MKIYKRIGISLASALILCLMICVTCWSAGASKITMLRVNTILRFHAGISSYEIMNDTDAVAHIKVDKARQEISISKIDDGTYYLTVAAGSNIDIIDDETAFAGKEYKVIFNDCIPGGGDDPCEPKASNSAHTHEWVEGEIYAATQNSDGLEGTYCKTCGAIKESHPISAMDYAINKYAEDTIRVAKPGQKITLEFGEWNSFPRYMMEKVAARMNENITFVFKFKQNKKMQTVTIEPETEIDLQYNWYGPDKMKELYGAE